jgi:hypothetical protein
MTDVLYDIYHLEFPDDTVLECEYIIVWDDGIIVQDPRNTTNQYFLSYETGNVYAAQDNDARMLTRLLLDVRCRELDDVLRRIQAEDMMFKPDPNEHEVDPDFRATWTENL